MDTTDKAEKAEIEKEFRKALGRARMLVGKNVLSKEEMWNMYGLFQQATEGNCNDWKFFNVSMLDLDSKGKFAAWAKHRGMKQLEAKQLYAANVDLMATKYGIVFPTGGSRFGTVASLASTATALSSSSTSEDKSTTSNNGDTADSSQQDISLP